MSISNVMDKLAVVQFDGKVTWVPHVRLQSFCGLQMKHFPFDTQTCRLLFGSWTYDSTKLDLHLPDNVNSSKYIWDGKEWDIIHYSARKNSFAYTTITKEEYPYVIYTLKMKRVSLFYGTLLVAPIILMAVLTIFLFLIPPEAGERISLGG